MPSNEKVVIKVNKPKILLVLLGSLVMVAASLYLLSADEGTRRMSLFYLHMMGWVSLLISGLASIYIIIELLLGTMSGLTFSSAGITDNSSMVSVGFIPWNEITSYHMSGNVTYDCSVRYPVRIKGKYNLKLLIVLIKDPNEYKKTDNFIKRFYKRANDKAYGSPIVISPGILKISTSEFLKITDEFYKKYGDTA